MLHVAHSRLLLEDQADVLLLSRVLQNWALVVLLSRVLLEDRAWVVLLYSALLEDFALVLVTSRLLLENEAWVLLLLENWARVVLLSMVLLSKLWYKDWALVLLLSRLLLEDWSWLVLLSKLLLEDCLPDGVTTSGDGTLGWGRAGAVFLAQPVAYAELAPVRG